MESAAEIAVVITGKGGGVLLRRKGAIWTLPSVQFEANTSAQVLAYQLVKGLTSMPVSEDDLRLLMVNHHGGEDAANVVFVFEFMHSLRLLPRSDGPEDEWELFDVSALPLTLTPVHNEVILSRQTGARYRFFRRAS